MLAFVGTAISTVVIAVMMWLLGVLRLSFRVDFFHATLFGSIISATDPVTVLAVFGRLKADKNLNALVFGESVMNDAVAIVLYQVVSSFSDHPVTFMGVLGGLWKFVYIFVGSLLIGLVVAGLAAILFRTQYFRNEHAPVEAGLVIILAYSSFYITYGIGCAPQTSSYTLSCAPPAGAGFMCQETVVFSAPWFHTARVQVIWYRVHHVLWHGHGQVRASEPLQKH